MYFGADIKAKIEKQQTDTARQQQAAQAETALQGAAQAAVGAVSGGKFPDAATLVQGLTGQGLYVKTAATKAAATETGTVYLIEDATTTKQVVLAIKDAKGKLTTATQKTKGDPKLS
jgi:hypothetical protein